MRLFSHDPRPVRFIILKPPLDIIPGKEEGQEEASFRKMVNTLAFDYLYRAFNVSIT